MKRTSTIWLIGLLLATVIPVMVKVLPTPLPDKACSPLYQRYCHTPGVEASFVKGFRINDTLAIDATLLRATDSASWATLKTDFSIPDLPPDFQQDIDSGIDLISTKLIPKSPPPPPDIFPNDVLVISSLNRTVTVFHVSSKDEWRAIMYHNLEYTVRQCTKDNPQ